MTPLHVHIHTQRGVCQFNICTCIIHFYLISLPLSPLFTGDTDNEVRSISPGADTDDAKGTLGHQRKTTGRNQIT